MCVCVWCVCVCVYLCTMCKNVIRYCHAYICSLADDTLAMSCQNYD